MATTTLKIYGAPRPAAPRGASLVDLLLTARDAVSRLFASRRHVPSRIEEASRVREMAYRLFESDPGFARDLMAAADRHEYMGG